MANGITSPFEAAATTPFEEHTKPCAIDQSTRAYQDAHSSMNREVSMGGALSEASGLSETSTTGRNGWGDLLEDNMGSDKRQLSTDSGICHISR